MGRFFVIALLFSSLGNLLAQQIPLQTFITAGGATGSVYSATSVPTYFSSVGQPLVIGRPVSTNTGGGVMTVNEFMFATSTTLAPIPSAQPTSLTFSSITSSSASGSFVPPSTTPDGYIVIRKSGSQPASLPSIGVSYNSGNTFGDATVVYVGTATTFNDTGLSPATNYYYEVFSYDGSGTSVNYLTSSPLAGNQSTLAALPSSQPTALTFSSVAATALTGSFTPATGSPTGYLVIRKSGAAPQSLPAGGNTYNAATALGDATVVSVGAATSFNDTGLSPSTTYYYVVFSYSGNGATLDYLTTSPLTGNLSTLAALPSSQPTALTFSSVTSNSLTGSFTAATGSPAGYLVIRKSGSAPTSIPAGGNTYTAASALGDATVVSIGTATTFNDTGLSPSTNYYYEVFSFNGSAAIINYLTANPLSANQLTLNADTTPPSITGNNTPSAVPISTAVTVSVTVLDNESQVQNVTISYGPADSTALRKNDVNMTNVSGNNWTYQVPGNAVTDLGLFYEIQAFSGGGNTQYTPYTVGITYTGTGLSVPYSSFGTDVSDYRIVSVPLTLTSNTVNNVFGDEFGNYGDITKWRMYRYDNGATTELTGSTTIDPGKGYWLIAASGSTINTGSGTTVQANDASPFQISLKADWNEIGNPYNYNISWADVQAANPNLPGLRTYAGTFGDGTVLKKLEGGFVKVNTAQTLVFPISKNAAVNGRQEGVLQNVNNALDARNWEVKLILQQGDLTNLISGFGMNEKASSGFDAYDGFNMPRFFAQYLELNHAKKEGNDYYSKDIVPSSEDQIWKFTVESTLDNEAVSMKWDNTYFGENDRVLFLWDVDLQRALNMRTSNSYSFDKTKSRSFEVVYGSEEFVKDNTSVSELVVHGVWPNPSSADVTLAFSVPQSTSDPMVELSMVDIMGREIWMAQNRCEGGYQEVSIKRSPEENAGLYIIRVKNGSTIKQIRLVYK